MQREAGGERKVECELHAVAFGEVALALARMRDRIGAALRGIHRAPLPDRNERALHVTRFEPIEMTKGN